MADDELQDVLDSAWPERALSPGRVRWKSLGRAAASSATAALWHMRPADDETGRGVVLKVLHHSTEGHRHWLSSEDPADPMYWRREANAYADGLLEMFAPIQVPTCRGVFEQPDGTAHLWIDEADGTSGANWTLDSYRRAARDLGIAQGHQLLDGALPERPWLANGWLRAYVEKRAQEIEADIDASSLEHPLLRSLDRASIATLQGFFGRRREIFALLDAQPHVLCHTDFWPRNLFATPTAIAAVDWAYVGIGILGEDIGNLVPDTMLDLFVDSRDDAPAFAGLVIQAYLDGIKQAGAEIDDAAVRFVVTATAALKYAWVGPRLVAMVAEPATLVHSAEELGSSVIAFVERRAALVSLLGQFAMQASAYAGTLSTHT